MPNKNSKEVTIKDIMTIKVISIIPDMPVIEAAKIITEHNFAGLPVVDNENHLIGILTEYDLITKTSSQNASFLKKIINEINPSEKTDSEENEKSISELTVKDVMNPEPLTLKEDATFDDVIETFKAHHKVNPIPIVNDRNQIVGIVSRFDVLRPLNIIGYAKKK